MCKELVLRKSYLKEAPIHTIYFGGGTPSILLKKDLNIIFDCIAQHYDLNQLSEITLEANPDDINATYLQEIKSLGINRLSIGIQSFNDHDLQNINRRHNSKQAIDAVKIAQENGLTNISIDLIYGLPDQNLKDWRKNIQQAIDLNVPHISAYHLTYEKGTPIYALKDKGISEDKSLTFFETLIKDLETAGFEQYEISNFAKPSFRSKHNSTYWQQTAYLGIGASAHSYNKKTRSWNVADLKTYIQQINNKLSCSEEELLSENDIYNELIITSLRTKEGVNISLISTDKIEYFMQQAQVFIKQKLLCQQDNFISLNKKGIFVSDTIIRDLMYYETD